ncbi:MAG: RNA polymerase sigma factor [Myxococcales bacterium]|nr:MAG: RNA polymerase sigma factor [Myxococcales bacterium]
MSASEVSAPAPASLSFDRVYEDMFDFVYRNARHLGVPEHSTEDVVQEVFLVLHRRLSEYDGRTTLRSWVYGILANCVRSYRRSFRRKQAPLVPAESEPRLGPASSGEDPEQRAANRQDRELLLRLLSELSEEQRELIVLGEVEQLSVAEICSCIGGNPNTVYSRLRAAREALRKKVAQHLLQRRVSA